MVQGVAHPAPARPTTFALTMTTEESRNLAQVLKAVADATRLRMLHLLAKHGGEMCVCDLVNAVGNLEQPTISHHLRILHSAGLITYQKQGLHVYYVIDPQAIGRLAPVSLLLGDIFARPLTEGV